MQKSNKTTSPLLKILTRIAVLAMIVGLFLFYSDSKGYFNTDQTNDHTLRKWNSFYELTSKGIAIDVMLFGNSHLYTGINPKNLSLALGATAFVFAAPGTNVSDAYFGLKEAIKVCKPKLVIIETYGMNNSNPYQLSEGDLSAQFVSFSARRNFLTKLTSTPYLFSAGNYLSAWSTTIRNHDYLFTDQEQIKKNKTLVNRAQKTMQNQRLYLGRYVRFTSGVEKEILEKYKKEGAPVKGENYTYSESTEFYVKKVVELCDKENIKLMFLTLPMYEKHISNYGSWNKKLSELLNLYPNKWLDMQKMPDYKGFEEFAFENTYNNNQHMTYSGSLLATYKLVHFIRDSLTVKFSMRQKEAGWHRLFYGDEGYFENFNPLQGDKNNKIIFSEKKLNNFTLKSLLLLDLNNKKMNRIIAKVDKHVLGNVNYQDIKLRLLLKFEYQGEEQVANIDLIYDLLHRPKDEVIFTSSIKPLKIKEIVGGALIKQ